MNALALAPEYSGEPYDISLIANPVLGLAAAVLDDIERVRIANANRLRILTKTTPDEDGVMRGFAITTEDKKQYQHVINLETLNLKLAQDEEDAIKNLERVMKENPLYPWVQKQKGMGTKQVARLLATFGDPYLFIHHSDPEDRNSPLVGEPRLFSELRSYCGHGDATRRKFKGMSQAQALACGNKDAKKRLWGISGSVLKAQGEWAHFYYDRREKTEGKIHERDCVRCGPSGHPAKAGSPWSKAHQHADGLRILGKEILLGLYVEAQRLHEG
jgi:hypothetical protein